MPAFRTNEPRAAAPSKVHAVGTRRKSLRRSSITPQYEEDMDMADSPSADEMPPPPTAPDAAWRGVYCPDEDEPDPVVELSQRSQKNAKRKGPDYTPRAPNCFILFRNWMIARGNIPGGVLNTNTISKVVSAAWTDAPEGAKQYWRELAAQVKFKHSLEYPDYRFKPKHKPRGAKKTASIRVIVRDPVTGDDIVQTRTVPAPKPPKEVKRKAARATAREQARDKAKATYMATLFPRRLSKGTLALRLSEWEQNWDHHHPIEMFQHQEAAFSQLPFPIDTTQQQFVERSPSAELGEHLPTPAHLLFPPPAIETTLLVPTPSPAAPQWLNPFGHRRSISQPTGMDALMYPAPPAQFFPAHHEEPLPAVSNFFAQEDRAYFGRRRSSSVGALQFAEVNANGRRGSVAQTLYPQAWQNGTNFLPPAHIPPVPMFNTVDESMPQFEQPMFNPSFSFSNTQKTSLPPLSLAPHAGPFDPLDSFRKLSITAPTADWSQQYSAGPNSSNIWSAAESQSSLSSSPESQQTNTLPLPSAHGQAPLPSLGNVFNNFPPPPGPYDPTPVANYDMAQYSHDGYSQQELLGFDFQQQAYSSPEPSPGSTDEFEMEKYMNFPPSNTMDDSALYLASQ